MEEPTIAMISNHLQGLGIGGNKRNEENGKPPWEELRKKMHINELDAK